MAKYRLSQESTLLEKGKEQLGFIDIVRKAVAMGGPVLALILLMAYFSIASPYFATSGNMINVARQASINIMLATGQTLVILSGGIDLSVGAVMALAASVSAVAMTYYGVNVWLGMAIGSIRQILGSLFNSYCWKTYAETYEHYPDEELTRQSRKLETSSRR